MERGGVEPVFCKITWPRAGQLGRKRVGGVSDGRRWLACDKGGVKRGAG